MFERIMRLLDEEQKLGKPEALTVLGFLYFQGIHFQRDKALARKLFQRAAWAGDSRANYLCYLFDTGEVFYLFKSMLDGYSNAINSFGLAIEKRRVHFEGGNLEEVSSLCYKKASDNGSATGKHYLGICYE